MARADVLVVRRPVFDAQRRLCGYELEVRPAALSDAAPASAPQPEAVVADLLTGLDLQVLAGDLPVLVRLPAALLEAGTPVLGPDRLLLLLDPAVPHSGLAAAACAAAAGDGYRIVLDVATALPPDHALLPSAAAIKVDMAALDLEEVRAAAALARRRSLGLYAGGVADAASLQTALSLGCTLVEGVFFQRPSLLGGRALSPAQLSRLQLLTAVSRPEVDFGEVEGLIKGDASLALRFLAYVNSSSFGWRTRITSLRHALSLVGEQGIRRWASVLALAGSRNADSPAQALLESAVARGRFCEALAIRSHAGGRLHDAPFEAFLAGLLSLLDAVFEQPLDDVLSHVSVPDAVRQALQQGTGDIAALLRLARAYERGSWTSVGRQADALGLRVMDVASDYLAAVEWTAPVSAAREAAPA